MSLNLILEGFVAPNGQGNFNFRGLNDGASVNFILNMLSHLSTGGTTITGTVKGTTGGGGGSGGSGTDFVENIIQTAHGLLVGNVVRLSGAGTYTKAQANNAVNAEVVGIVVAVIDANTFTICYGGYIDPTLLVFTGLTPNSVYFLSPTTPGALTLTEPIAVGQVSKPLLWTDYPNSGYFFNMRGKTVSSSSGGGGGMSMHFGLGVPTVLGSDGDLYFESFAGTMYIQSPQNEVPHIVGPVQVNGFTGGVSNSVAITTPLQADTLILALAFNANTTADTIGVSITVGANGQSDYRNPTTTLHFTATPITSPVQHSFGAVAVIDLNGVQLVGATINITTSVAVDHMHLYSIPLVGGNKSQLMVNSGNLPASQAVTGAGQVTAAYTMGNGLLFSLAWAANTAGTVIPGVPTGFTRIASSTYNTGGTSFSTSGLDVLLVPVSFSGTLALGTASQYNYLTMQFAANGSIGSHWRQIIGI